MQNISIINTKPSAIKTFVDRIKTSTRMKKDDRKFQTARH